MMAGITALDQLYRFCAGGAASICSECETGSSSLSNCGPSLVNLLSRQSSKVVDLYSLREVAEQGTGGFGREKLECAPDLVLKRLDDLLSIAYSKFYAFKYKDLPECWRQLYTDASIAKFCLRLLFWTPFTERGAGISNTQDSTLYLAPAAGLTDLIRTLDLAIILAGAAGHNRGRRWIDKSFEFLQQVWLGTGWAQRELPTMTETERPTKRIKRNDEDQTDTRDSDITHNRQDAFSANEPFTPPVTCPIPRTQALSMEAFQRHLDESEDPRLGPKPLVIRGALAHWPAMTPQHAWCEPAYLLRQTFGGRRLVPVEIGRSYVDEGWSQKLVTFREFLADYIDPSLSQGDGGDETPIISIGGEAERQQHRKIAYLAQHPLLTQLPTLRADLLIPDYCYCAAPEAQEEEEENPPTAATPELDEPLLNAWFGPPGTITPLHTDPYHNILAQVVGRKYVRLYGPGHHDGKMRARGVEDGVDMANTSHIDVGVVEGWDDDPDVDDKEGDNNNDDNIHDLVGNDDEAAFAAFRTLEYVDCILEPGDMLYIPVGWWHYVRGLTVSFSVSFWWN